MKNKDQKNLKAYEEASVICKSQRLPISLCPFRYSDASTICSWVPTSEELIKISGDIGSCLTGNILESWCYNSIISIVLQIDDKPVAFSTLSVQEYDLPDRFVEVCHLVVAPNQRRKYFATVLLNYLRIIAARYNFKNMIGRVVRNNNPALRLAEYVRWDEIRGMPNIFDPQFRWFHYELRK